MTVPDEGDPKFFGISTQYSASASVWVQHSLLLVLFHPTYRAEGERRIGP